MDAPSFVNSVNPPLVEVNDENDIVSEAGHSVHCGHRDDETEQVVNNCVQKLVKESFGRQVVN